MAGRTKTNDGAVYPSPVAGDGETEVTRQVGVTFDQAAVSLPDLPDVIQVDPETVVTRQSGVIMVDGGSGVAMADRPVAPTHGGRVVSDQLADAKADYGFADHPGVVPVQASVDLDTERVAGEQKESDGNVEADRTAPGVQLVTLPDHMLTKDQRAYLKAMREAAATGKPYPSDNLAPDSVIVHDPVAAMREAAKASVTVPNDTARKRAAALAKAREAKAAKSKGKGKGKDGDASDAASVQQAQLQEALKGADNGPVERQSDGAAIKDGGKGAKPGEVEL